MSCELRVLKLCDRETNVVLQERTRRLILCQLLLESGESKDFPPFPLLHIYHGCRSRP